MDTTAEELLHFWLEEVGPEGWYKVDPGLDAGIRDRWGALWDVGRTGGLADWKAQARSTLALLILLDQFPRNMFRGDARSFASDPLALQTAKVAILHGRDRQIGLPERQFFYLPLMHSELQTNQDKSVRLFLTNFGREDGHVKHAVAHREVIRRFGRFPYRNAALGRASTAAEEAFLAAGGYPAMLKELAA
jgi:uncharacterized protein (DUF924 family)